MAEDRSQQQKFYTAPWDADVRIPASELRRLPLQKQQDIIEHWFSEMFDSPVDPRFKSSGRGTEPLNLGGHTRAELGMLTEFHDIADPEAITAAAAAAVESVGLDIWVPNEKHPHYIRPTRVSVTNPPEYPEVPPVDNNKDQSRVYEHPDGFEEKPVAPQDICKLSNEDQMRLMAGWFFHLHEDPQAETPYDGQEGGYLYIHGGPYDAREVLEEEFGEIAGADIIEKAISYVESDGTSEWAPSPNHPERSRLESEARASLDIDEAEHPISTGKIFRANSSLSSVQERNAEFDHDQIDDILDHGVRTSFGTSYERAVRRTTLARAADLQALLAKPVAKPKHGGIGHNQPPSEITLDEEHTEQLKEAVETISKELNAELRNEQPDVRKVSRAARAIQSIGKWVAQKLDMTLETFLKSLATALGTSAAAAITAAGLLGYDPVVRKAMELYQSVIDWLNAVVLPM